MPGWRGLALMASVAGMTGVLLAAMGAHLDGGIDQFGAYRAWQSANLMHLLHAVALLGLSALSKSHPSKLLGLAGLLMFLGIGLFSGSVYTSVLSESGGALAPFGGIMLALSWLLIGLITVGVRR